MTARVQWIVITVLCAALGVLTSLLLDARTRLDAVEHRSAPATSTHDDGEAHAASRDDSRDGVAHDIADLRLRVATLERAAQITPPARTDARDDDTSPARPDGALANADGAAAPTPIARAVRTELDKAEQEREAARSERWRQRTVEKMNAFAEDNKLSDKQKAQLTDMVDAETQEIRGLFRDARDSGDFTTTRDQARALRAKTEDNAKAVLDDDQFAAFKKMRDDESSRFANAFGGAQPR